MIRFSIIALLLTSCSTPPPPAPPIDVPDVQRTCHAPAPSLKPMPPLHTLDQLKTWAAETAKARDIDRAALIDCDRRLNDAVEALDALRAQIASPR